jgi:hypothetical protein
MTDIKKKIIQTLKDEERPLSTKELMSNVSDEYDNLRKSDQYEEARKYHRNFLYHINKLLRENILRFEKYGENGEKFFVLNISEGEEICEITPRKFVKKVLPNKFYLPTTPLEGYEQKGILKKEDYLSRMDRVNSFVIDCKKQGTKTGLLSTVDKFAQIVTDCLCLGNFNLFLGKANILKELNRIGGRYGKKIILYTSVSKLKNEEIGIIEKGIELDNLDFVFKISKKEILDKPRKFSKLIDVYKRNQKEIFLKNKKSFNSPYFAGTLGVYSFNESEWNSRRESDFYECCQNSAIVDMKKFYDEYGFNVSKFSELLLNIAKSFLKVNPLKRKKLREYVHSDDKQYYEMSRDYIRLWNFGMLEPDLDKEKVLEIVEKAKTKLGEFCKTEDRIFNACGMPIRFNVALTYASKNAETGLSFAKFKRFEIENSQDLRTKEFRIAMEESLRILSHFDGGMHMSFHRLGKEENKNDIVKEILFLLDKYKLPFFSYDFGGFNNGGI